ncbi:MAG: hypothetical protein HKN43_14670 [Rhodothermales bacterium]|nr:hypothetical protein [Rhodothermales bacterium]
MRSFFLSILLAGTIGLTALAQDIKDVEGSWIAEINEFSSLEDYRQASLTLKWESEGERYRYTFQIPMRELESYSVEESRNDPANFELDREAGHLSFSGTMDDDIGSGKFHFSANSEFVEEMSTLGYENISPDEQLKMAIYDVTAEFVKRLREMNGDSQS